jgi:SPP1 family predicted phage head-tail adaptor
MNIGSLNRRITLQSPTRTADGMGGFTVVWGTVDTVWAAVWPTSAREALEADKPQMTTTHRIRIRYRTVDPSWRVQYGDRYFTIESILNPSEAGKMLDLLCREAVA